METEVLIGLKKFIKRSGSSGSKSGLHYQSKNWRPILQISRKLIGNFHFEPGQKEFINVLKIIVELISSDLSFSEVAKNGIIDYKWTTGPFRIIHYIKAVIHGLLYYCSIGVHD